MHAKIYEIKSKLTEFVKYDIPLLQFPIVLLLAAQIVFLYRTKKILRAIELASKVHRSGWWGSEKIILKIVQNTLFRGKNAIENRELFIEQLVDSLEPKPNTKKFFADPQLLFDGVCLFLKRYNKGQKGVLLIKYSYYFPLLFKFYDMNALSERYHIVLEPSWAGTCEPGILAYATLNASVFVMAYEARDTKFLDDIGTNLKPVPLSSNWWVDHRNFKPAKGCKKDIDIIVISSWTYFKRHYRIFDALRQLKQSRPHLKVALVGYNVEMTLDDIKALASYYNVDDLLEYHEKIPPTEVGALLKRSKINLLWSRFEGLNRSIIEGMFSDVPCIIRKGFNYGMKYPYINDKTGIWSEEKALASNIKSMLENYQNYAPRDYVMQHHTCFIATQILTDTINAFCTNESESVDKLAVKVNLLDCMTYFDASQSDNFKSDIENTRCMRLPT
jgi:glycosyltransferase involved in cell wall biosynthesis